MDNNEKAKALEAELAELEKEPVTEQPVPAPEPEKEPEPQVTPEKEPETEPVSKEPKQEERVERKVYSIPLDKHNKQIENARKAAREEALREAEEKYRSQAVQKPSEPSNDVKAFAEEHEMDEAVVEKLIDLAASRAASSAKSIPDDLLEEVNNLKKQREIQTAKKQFEDEFNSSVIPLITKENPNVTQAQIQEIKNTLDELAFSSRYNTYALEDIYRVKSHEFDIKPKMSVESSRGGSRQGVVDFSTISEAELSKMSPQEAEKYFEWEKNNKKGSKYLN